MIRFYRTRDLGSILINQEAPQKQNKSLLDFIFKAITIRK